MDCSLCGKTGLPLHIEGLRNSDGRVFYCADCDLGLLQTQKFDPKAYYDGEYRQKFSEILEAPNGEPDFMYNYHKDFQADRLRIVGEFFNPAASFLEIGCSAGQFLAQLKPHFGRVAGVELDSGCADYVRTQFDIAVYDQELADCGFGPGEFHYAAAFQVLEHTYDPVAFLRDMAGVLQLDGRVFIEVPNLRDPLLSLWRVPAYHRFYYHEAHTHYFSARSLEKVATAAGYRIEALHYLQDYNFMNHLYWHFNNGPQRTGEFGLAPPRIQFNDDHPEAGEALNALFQDCDKRYKAILAEHGLTSNMFAVLARE
ncbi:MAG: class I SAM-dependent methyltransferase [Acidobacteriota bacterium]|nr:class I SAM-dependent methyltransferase [Acidobacteriota bacterium]